MDRGGPSGASWRTGHFSIRSLTFTLWVWRFNVSAETREQNMQESPRVAQDSASQARGTSANRLFPPRL